MAYRFVLEVPEEDRKSAEVIVGAVPDTQIVVSRLSFAEGVDRPYAALTIASEQVRVIEVVYDWMRQDGKTDVRVVLLDGQRLPLADFTSDQIVAEIRTGQPWGIRTVPRIGDHTEEKVVIDPSQAQASSTAVASQNAVTIEQVNLLSINVADLRKAEEFYREFFGLQIVGRAAYDADGKYRMLGDDYDWERAIVTETMADETFVRNGHLILGLHRVGSGSATRAHQYRPPFDPGRCDQLPANQGESAHQFPGVPRGNASIVQIPRSLWRAMGSQFAWTPSSCPQGCAGGLMLDEYQDLIEELLGTPGIVRESVPLDPARLKLVAAVHARDAMALDRVQRLVRESSPYFTTLPDFAASLAATADPGDPAALLETFETTRGDLVSLLMNLTLKDWERTATHDERGEIALVDVVEEHVEFDEAFRAKFASLAVMRLEGKVALVTGGSTGIGRASVFRMAAEGATIVVADINDVDGQQTVSQVGGRYVHCDVAEIDQVERAVRETVQAFGAIDILVNSAAFLGGSFTAGDMPEEEWRRGIAVTLDGVFYASKFAVQCHGQTATWIDRHHRLGGRRGRRRASCCLCHGQERHLRFDQIDGHRLRQSGSTG